MLILDDISRRLRDMEPFAKDTLLTPFDRSRCEHRPIGAEMEFETVEVQPPAGLGTQRQFDNGTLAKCDVVVTRKPTRKGDMYVFANTVFLSRKPLSKHKNNVKTIFVTAREI